MRVRGADRVNDADVFVCGGGADKAGAPGFVGRPDEGSSTDKADGLDKADGSDKADKLDKADRPDKDGGSDSAGDGGPDGPDPVGNDGLRSKPVWKSYKYRLYPNERQKAYFNDLFRCCRHVYNHFLKQRIDAWEASKAGEDVRIPTSFDMSKELASLKRQTLDGNGHPFLKDVDSTSYLYEIQALSHAFSNFFRRAKSSCSKPGFPRFKGVRSKRSATIAFKKADAVEGRRIKFPKIGWVRANVHRPIGGDPVCATIRHDSADRWWVSIKCKDVREMQLPENDRSIVIDLNEWPSIKADDGKVIAVVDAQPAAEDERRFRRELRRLRRKEAPNRNEAASKRYEKQRIKVARICSERSNRLQAEIERISASLIAQFGSITVIRPAERLSGGAGELIRELEYKCDWYGRDYSEIDDAGRSDGM